MPGDLRIESHPYLKFDRGKKIRVRLGHRYFDAHENESLGAALWANGVRILSRSFKFHRPRGLFCVAGNCPNCLMQVNGTPNVRVCTRRAKAEDHLVGQNCWPSLEVDFLRTMDYLDFLFPTGFQYRRFIRPRFLWPLYARLIRNLAGIGNLPKEAKSQSVSRKDSETDILVVGGGPAGILAAVSAAKTGASTLLIDENSQLGGQLNYQTQVFTSTLDFNGMRSFQIASDLRDQISKVSSVKVLASTTAFGCYEDGTVLASSEDSIFRIRARAVVFATGSIELPMIFENNDLPGVIMSSGAEILMHRYGVKPGKVVVVVGVEQRALVMAQELLDAGVHVKAVAVTSRIEEDSMNLPISPLGERPRLLLGWRIERALGKNSVKGARLIQIEDSGTEEILCDTICVASAFRPANELLLQTGCEVEYDLEAGGFVPLHDSDMRVRTAMYVAGDAAGTNRSLEEILAEGELAGLSAAASFGFEQKGTRNRLEELKKCLEARRPRELLALPPSIGKKSVVCYCLDVMDGEIADAIDEGFSDVETLKRYTGMTMGPCQGKQCLYALIGSLVAKKQLQPSEIGIPTQRPPLRPVPLGLLSGDES